MLPKFLENTVILCFERRFSKRNSVIRLKLNILPPKISGLATPLPKPHILSFYTPVTFNIFSVSTWSAVIYVAQTAIYITLAT